MKEAGPRPGEIAWNDIDRPGCYLIVDSGDLLRIPAEALTAGGMPVISWSSHSLPRLARISNNAAEPLGVLRAMARQLGHHVNF